MNLDVCNYLNSLKTWKDELTTLQKIILNCGLDEDFKWMHPCYTYENKNILIIHEFKNYCAILFLKGVLLKDSENILIQQTKHTQYARQIRFTALPEILELESIIKKYIKEAIEIEKYGLKIKKKETADFEIPDELKQKFKENPDFEKAFKNLTAGRQRGYLLFFSKPKQSKTITLRINKNMNRILDGKGLHDCTCGLSKRMPNCDGSHKALKNNNKL